MHVVEPGDTLWDISAELAVETGQGDTRDMMRHVQELNDLDDVTLDAGQRPLAMVDEMEIDGVRTPRLFVSARSGEGMPALRAELARLSGSVAEEMSLDPGAPLHDAPG